MEHFRCHLKRWFILIFGAICIQYQINQDLLWLNVITMTIVGAGIDIFLKSFIREKIYRKKLTDSIIYGFIYLLLPVYGGSSFLLDNISIFIYFFATVTVIAFAWCRDTDDIQPKRQWWEYLFVGATAFIIWGPIICQNYMATSVIYTISLMIILMIWTQNTYDFLTFLIKEIVNEHKNQIDIQTIKDNEWRIWSAFFLVMFFVGFFMSIVHYPGVITPDTMLQWTESRKLECIENRKDYMSFAYTCFFAIFTQFTDNFYPITFVCMLFYGAVWASMMQFLCKRGLKIKWAIGVTFFWLLIPINQVFIAAAWKDIPYSLCVMSLGIILYKMYLDAESMWLEKILLIFIFLGTALLRSSGVIVDICSIAVFIGIMHKERKLLRKHMITGITLIALMLFIKGPLYSIIKVDRGPEGFAALPFIDGVWENVYAGNDLPLVAKEYLTNIMPIEEFENGYVEAYTNTWAIPGGYSGLDVGASIKAYLSCLKIHPFTTILARFKRTYNLWALFPDRRFLVNSNYNP